MQGSSDLHQQQMMLNMLLQQDTSSTGAPSSSGAVGGYSGGVGGNGLMSPPPPQNSGYLFDPAAMMMGGAGGMNPHQQQHYPNSNASMMMPMNTIGGAMMSMNPSMMMGAGAAAPVIAAPPPPTLTFQPPTNTLRSSALEDAANFKFIAHPNETASVSGFTKEKYTNPFIPSYVPPEIFIMDRGLFLDAFLARCAIHDCARLVQHEQEESFFANAKLETKFDSKGNRVNVAAELLSKRNQDSLNYLKKLISRFRNEATRDGEVSFKYHFKPHEIPLIGSLFGARGETQKWLVKESGVLRIEFAGKGLTKRQKRHNAMKGADKSEALEHEEPHAFIVGYEKAAVGEAARLIEWLLSDAPDAVAKRDENHRKLKVKDGTYDPNTYTALSERNNGGIMGLGAKRDREEGAEGGGGANAEGGGAGDSGGEAAAAAAVQQQVEAAVSAEIANADLDFLDDLL